MAAIRDWKQDAADWPSIPSWNNVVRTQGAMFPGITDRAPEFVRVERVQHDDRIIPAVFVKYPDAKFRTQLADDTPAQILMDVVTVFPFKTPIAYVVPIIFDEIENPFYYIHGLHIVPPTKMHGVPIRYESPADPWHAARIALDFCQREPNCALMVLNEHNDVRLARVVPFEPSVE